MGLNRLVRLALPVLAVLLLAPACGGAPEGTRVTVTAQDHLYQGVPANLGTGSVSFRFQNRGREVHEFHLFRVAAGAPVVQQLLELPDEELMANLTSVGITSANPGQVSNLQANVTAGRYLALCMIPLGTLPGDGHAGHDMDGEMHPPRPDSHFRSGMYAEITVG